MVVLEKSIEIIMGVVDIEDGVAVAAVDLVVAVEGMVVGGIEMVMTGLLLHSEVAVVVVVADLVVVVVVVDLAEVILITET